MPKIVIPQGFAVINTKHVLCALRAYELKAETSSVSDAIKAAIECYAALSRRRVCDRTIRRWLTVLKSYGGEKKIPENAFGVRKSHPQIHQPVRKYLKQIEEISENLLKSEFRQKTSYPDSASLSQELAIIQSAVAHCLASIEENLVTGYLQLIKRQVRRLRMMRTDKLFRYSPPRERETAVSEIVNQLENIQGSRKAA